MNLTERFALAQELCGRDRLHLVPQVAALMYDTLRADFAIAEINRILGRQVFAPPPPLDLSEAEAVAQLSMEDWAEARQYLGVVDEAKAGLGPRGERLSDSSMFSLECPRPKVE
jgi:hypothetical protein